MQSEKSQQITIRFFKLLDELVASGQIHFITDFYREHNINLGNIHQLRNNPAKDILQMEWLTILVEKYGASGDYLLIGKGPHFKKPLTHIERPKRRKYNKVKEA